MDQVLKTCWGYLVVSFTWNAAGNYENLVFFPCIPTDLPSDWRRPPPSPSNLHPSLRAAAPFSPQSTVKSHLSTLEFIPFRC